jgi:plastocyanin
VTHAVRRAAARAFAVAVLAHGLATGVKLPLPKPEVVVQEDKEFRPFVKAVLVGTPVQFPNRDDVLHHVYSFSPPKPFELKAYAGTPQEPVVFDRPGPVALGCNIHDWMLAYIYVSESPHFVTTAADGTARLARLPQGSYTVRVWHPRLAAPEASTARAVVVGANGAVEAAWTLKLKRDSRVRRAPSASGRGYR